MATLKDLVKNGRDLSINPRTKLGLMMKQQGVSRTLELDRIVRLPRRDPQLDDAEWARKVSTYLKTPTGEMGLRPFQAAALRDIHDFGGAFIQGRVGIGKTLIVFLAPVLLSAKRPLVLIPAKLREKTKREFAELAKHWLHIPMHVESYARISRRGDEILNQIKPDVILADECHKLKNTDSAVTRKVSRYVKKHAPHFVALSGTVATRSLKDFAHVLYWCLPQACPLPTRWSHLQEWALCVDENIPPTAKRLASGALELLMNEEEKALDTQEPTIGARRAVQRRIADTPGCIMSTDRFTGSSLTIDLLRVEPPKVEEEFRRLRDLWETPTGVPLADGMQVHRTAMELATGFHYVWDPEPPPEWLTARKEWCAAVRYILKTNRRGLDSELPVRNAVARGEYNGKYVMRDGFVHIDQPIDALLDNWLEVRDTFNINSVPVWVDDSALHRIAEFPADVYWVKHTTVGRVLSEITGMPYFAQKGLTEDGDLHIYDHDGPCIASWLACGEGLNLQKWSRQLIVTPPTQGKTWEQLLGRMHREGQKAEEVETYMVMLCEEHYNAWTKALSTARFIQDTTGQEQKLLYGDILIPEYDDVCGTWPLWVG